MRALSRVLDIAKWTVLVLAALSTYLLESGTHALKMLIAAFFAMTILLWLPTIRVRWKQRHLPALAQQRFRRLAHRFMVLLAFLAVAVWAASITCFVRIPIAPDRAVAIGGGSLSFQSGPAFESGGPMNWVLRSAWSGFSLGESGEFWAGWPGGQSSYANYWPIGPPVILLVALVLGIFLDRRRQVPAGHCDNCGYNLTANQTGKCPECGTPRVDASIVKRPAEQSTPAK